MTDKKPELSDAMKKKLEPKKFVKNPILGTKFTIAIPSAKDGVDDLSLTTAICPNASLSSFWFKYSSCFL